MSFDHEIQSNGLVESSQTIGLAKSYVIAMERQGKEPHPYLATMAKLSLDEAVRFQPDEVLIERIDRYQERQREALIKGVTMALDSTGLLDEEIA